MRQKKYSKCPKSPFLPGNLEKDSREDLGGETTKCRVVKHLN